MRDSARTVVSVRYRHAFFQAVVEWTPEAHQFSEDCVGFAISDAVSGPRGFDLNR